MSSPARASTHSSDAIILASLFSTFLAPPFAYLGVFIVTGEPLAGLAVATLGSLYIVPFFPIAEPFLFLLVLASTGLIGWLLSHRGLGHPAVFVAVGIGIALLSWSTSPNLIASSGLLFVRRGGTPTDIAIAASGVAIGGALDGLAYWLMARHFTRTGAQRVPRDRG
jgi:hypothetical protein